MASLAGANVGPHNVGKSKARRSNEGVKSRCSRFFMKKVFGCFMPLWSKPEAEGASSVIVVTANGTRDPAVVAAIASVTRRPRLSQDHSPHLRHFTYQSLFELTFGFRFLLNGGEPCRAYKGYWMNVGSRSSPAVDGLTVAVKVPNIKGSLQDHHEFVTEVNDLGGLDHPHLVKLVGYCAEGDKRALVYEYLSRGSLEIHFFRRRLPLMWSVRMKIMLEAAKGLAYLNEEAEKPLIYRDFNSSNILLDEEFNAKLIHFELARDGFVGDFTREGYAAPEYIRTGNLTAKSNVYSFGVVLLEMLTGRKSIDIRRPVPEANLVAWAGRTLMKWKPGFLQRMMDPLMEFDGRSILDALTALELALQCISLEAKDRPLMSQVVEVLSTLQLPSYKNEMVSSSSSTFRPKSLIHRYVTQMTLGRTIPLSHY